MINMKTKIVITFLLISMVAMSSSPVFAVNDLLNSVDKDYNEILANVDKNGMWYRNYFGEEDGDIIGSCADNTLDSYLENEDVLTEVGEVYTYSENTNNTYKGWQSCGQMTTARSYMSSVAFENNIYTFGGTESGIITNKTEFYDTSNETWTSKTNMPIGRYKHNAVVCGTYIYICGGYDENNNGIDYIDVYNTATDSWETAIETPNHNTSYGSGIYNNELYIFGGMEGGEKTTQIYKYNFDSNEWAYVSSNPNLGMDSIVFFNGDGFRIISDWNIYQYNVPASFEKVDSVPRKVYDYTAVGFGESIYVIGGRDNKYSGVSITNVKYRSDGDTYNLVSGWIPEWYNDIRLIRGLACNNTVIVNGDMYVFGGQISYGVDQNLMFKRSLNDDRDDYPDDKVYTWGRYVYGSINGDGDHDNFIFIPDEDGYYEVRALTPIHSNNTHFSKYGFNISIVDNNGDTIVGGYYPNEFGAVYMEKDKEYTISIFDIEGVIRGNYMYEIARVYDDFPDEIENAEWINIGEDINKSFIGSKDIDCVKFEVQTSGDYRITINIHNEGADYDITVPSGKLYNSQLNELYDLSDNTVCYLEAGIYYMSLYPKPYYYNTKASKYTMRIDCETVYDTNVIYDNNMINISGYLKEINNDGIVRVFDPNNNVIAIDNLYSDDNRFYSYQLDLGDEHIQGTYQILISERGNETVYREMVDVGQKSNIFKIKYNNAVNLNETDLDVSISLAKSDGYTYLIASTIVDDADVQDMLFVGLYNNDGTLYDYTTAGISTWDQEEQILKTQITLPDNIINYYVKTYVCDGDDVYTGSMIPKSNTYLITGNDINNAINPNDAVSLQSTATFENFEIVESEELNFIQDNLDVPNMMFLPTNINMPNVTVDVTLMNNGFCTERILEDKANVSLDYVIKNNSTEDIDILPIMASYDEEGVLRNDKLQTLEATLKPGAKCDSIRLGFSLKPYDVTELTVKGFLWDNFSNSTPYINAIVLNNGNQDFYGDSFETSTRFPIGKCEGLKGYIDSSEDVDILRLEPDSTGEYEFKISGNDNFKITIYNETYQEVATYNFIDTDTFIEELSRNKTYYIKIESSNGSTGDYQLCENDIYVENYKKIDVAEWGVYMLSNDVSLYDNGYYLLKEASGEEGYTKVILDPGIYYIHDTTGTETLIKVELDSIEANVPVNGTLLAEDDFVVYSYTPAEDGVYNLSSSGTCKVSAVIYDSNGTEIGVSDNNDDLNYSVLLEADNIYYIKVAPKENLFGDYKVTLTSQTYKDNITIKNNMIQMSLPYGNEVTVSLYTGTNMLIKTDKITPSNGVVYDEFTLNNMQSDYKVQVKDKS